MGHYVRQYAYDPYGDSVLTSGSAGGNTLTYTGRQDDGTDLLYYRARYYSPTLGRFISQDPIGIAGGTNLYAYTGGDPTNHTDPSGNLTPVDCAAGALIDGGLDYLGQRLSGRKVDWGSVATSAAVGCVTSGLGDLFTGVKGAGYAEEGLGACLLNSFTADTPVLMADGTRKPIRDVKVGDRVRATDPVTNKTRSQTVTALIQGQGIKHLVQISTAGDDGQGGATITATDGHPFWVADRHQWLAAGQFQPGMWLQTGAGTHVQITGVRVFSQTAYVYNLTVSDLHTYYVGTGGAQVLVHNAGCTVLGRFRAVEKYVARHGGNRLELPQSGPGKWWWSKNRRFIQDAIDRGDEIVLVTDPFKTL